MGLLQRAEQLREEMALSPGHPLRSGGLRQRAELFLAQESGFLASKNGSPPIPFPLTGPGLLARAQRFRDQDREGGYQPPEFTPEVKESLEYAVSAPGAAELSAEEIQDWGEPVAKEELSDDEFLALGELPSQDELSDEEFLALGEFPYPEASEEEESPSPEEIPFLEEPSGEEPAISEGIPLPEEPFGVEAPATDEMASRDELSDEEFLALGEFPSPEEPAGEGSPLPEEMSFAAEPSGEEMAGSEEVQPPELPEWEYEEQSDISLEEAASTAATPSVFEEDEIFGRWGREAEEEARGLTRGEAQSDTSEESPFLFDDDTAQTTPVETHIASQKKIDNYLTLFDITREIATLNNIDNLWDTILYSVLGQLGPTTVLIFASRDARTNVPFFPTAHSGFDLPDNWMLKPGEVLYENMRSGEGARYAEEFLNNPLTGLSSLERIILDKSRASLLVPLKSGEKLYGIMMLGKQLGNEEYGLDDIEFVTRLGETVAFGVDRIMARTEYEQRTEELRQQNALHDRLFVLAHEVSAAQSLDEIYDLLGKHLREDFDVESYSLALLDPGQKVYYLLAGNRISPASVNKFRLPVSSELVAMISNLIRVYGLSDFQRNREITSCYTNDDLVTMQQYLIIPLISLNWLVGFITVHQTSSPWNDFKREMIGSAAEMISPAVANTVILGERESMFRDPFSPLETRLRDELQKAAEFQQPLSLVELRVKNMKRLITLNPPVQVTEFLADLGRAITTHLNETDYQARISQGRFAVLLPGRSRAESEIFIKKVLAEFKKRRFLPSSPLDVQYSHLIVNAPADTTEPEKMLAMLE